jgi:hypothetical protein
MLATMTSTAASTSPRTTARTAARTSAEQLTLLPSPAVNPRFQLSRDTRERGLRHVAEIRRLLAERRGHAAGVPTLADATDRAA